MFCQFLKLYISSYLLRAAYLLHFVFCTVLKYIGLSQYIYMFRPWDFFINQIKYVGLG